MISLIWPALEAPTIEHMVYEADDGTRSLHYALSIVGATYRGKMGRRTGASPTGGKTDAQWFHAISQSSSSLHTALLLWADPARTWPRLYRLLEELEQHISMDADKACLCSLEDRQRFRRSANTAAVAGRDARHADGRYQAPKDPMSLQNAVSFVRSVIHAYLVKEALRRQGDT